MAINNDVEEPISQRGASFNLLLQVLADDKYDFESGYMSRTLKKMFMRFLELIKPLEMDLTNIVHMSLPETRAQTAKPFFVVLKHEDEHIVVIRGTNNLGDAACDLDFESQPLQIAGHTHYFHKGFLACAQSLLAEIEALHIVNPIFVGYSMGAAIAAICSIITNLQGMQSSAWVFAQPACASKLAAERADSFIQSFLVENDVVPRASFAAVRNMMWRVHQLKMQSSQHDETVLTGKNSISGMRSSSGEIQAVLGDETDLFCAGVSHVLYAGQLEKVQREELAEMILSPVQMWDHFMSNAFVGFCRDKLPKLNDGLYYVEENVKMRKDE